MMMTAGKRRRHAFTISILLLLALGFAVLPAAATEPTDTAALKARLAADEALAARLDRQAAAEKTRLDGLEVADLFGPSDEEKAAAAAAAQREQNQDDNIARLSQQANDLEDSLRKLTGEIELLNHRLDEIDQRIDRVRKEFDYKLCMLSAQQLGAAASPSGTTDSGEGSAIPCNPAAGATTPSAQNAAPAEGEPAATEQAPGTGVTHLAPPPGDLGTLPEGESYEPPPSPPPAQAAPPAPPAQSAPVDPHAQFDAAMNMLAKSQYDDASGTFRAFVDANPNDPLAPQALYWLGDIAYVQKDFSSAARAFVEELKKYPTSPRAAESMLKLGQSLLAMDQKQEGCTTLRALAEKYPQASTTVLNEAAALRKAGGCRR